MSSNEKYDDINTLKSRLLQILERLPKESGVYILKDRKGSIIYIGKAKNLYSRVRSYFFRKGDTRAFVGLLTKLLGDIETIVTSNEKEALLLENNLIKKHKPRFNVMLRDDKNYLVLRLDPSASFPRLEITRKIKTDRAWYFGPYSSAASCRETLRLINRYFQLRTCTNKTMEARQRPCLQYQIKRCMAPCVFDIDKQQYQLQIKDVALFLQGKETELISDLENRMKTASTALDFEHAARLRDQIDAVKRTLQKQYVVDGKMVDQDVFGYYREGSFVDFVVLNLRQGKLLGQQSFSFSGQEFPDEELLSSFVNLYYDKGNAIPSQIIVPRKFEDIKTKTEWLTELSCSNVQILVPRKGNKLKLLNMAQQNAKNSFLSRRQRQNDLNVSLTELQHRLHLKNFPNRIECYDISGIMGQQVVASMVVMLNGEPCKKDYRHFKIQGLHTDDFAALYQVLARRFRRFDQWELADLIVVDGGKGQLSMALAAMKDATLPSNIKTPDIIALAKEHISKSSNEDRLTDRVFLPNIKDPIFVLPNSLELFMLSRIRDEAHRFAITYHKKLRRQKTIKSALDDIPKIGPKRKQALLKTLKTVEQIQHASIEELAKIPTMNLKAAESLVTYFAGSKNPDKK